MQTATDQLIVSVPLMNGACKLFNGCCHPFRTISFRALLLLLCLLLGGAVLAQTTYYVKTTGSDINSGTSWAQAFQTLQKALSTAGTSGDQIWVAHGTYYPDEGAGLTNNDRFLSFNLKSGVGIYGGFAGTETQLNQRNWKINVTILSGDIDQAAGKAGNAYHVVNNVNVSSTAILDGFTIAEGNADNVPVFPHDRGGGILNNNASPSLANCKFSGNNAQRGGGIYNDGSSSPSLTNCNFLGNTALINGGAMFFNGSPSSLINCAFSQNSAAIGAGIENVNSLITLTNCSFSGNTGSAALHNQGASPVITNCIFWGNSSEIDNNIASNPIVNYSIVQGGYPGGNNLDEDPLFVNAAAGDLHLMPCSPAIERGSDAANATATDLDGNVRKVDAIAGGSQIDMGAYEFQGDLDADNDGYPYCNNEDCNDNNANTWRTGTFYADNDGDGYTVNTGAQLCYGANTPNGYQATPSATSDCNDNNPNVYQVQTWYQNKDGDGYAGQVVQSCGMPSGMGWSTTQIPGGDCNDNDNTVYPGATEICDRKDNDCDASVDEGFPNTDGDGQADCVDSDDDNDGVPDDYDCAPLDKKNDKWLVCHKGQTLCIAGSAVQAHLNHGDYLGTCGAAPPVAPVVRRDLPKEKQSGALRVQESPNPSAHSFTLTSTSSSDKPLMVCVTDMLGRTVETKVNVAANGTIRIGEGYRPGTYVVQVIQGSERQIIKLLKGTQ